MSYLSQSSFLSILLGEKERKSIYIIISKMNVSSFSDSFLRHQTTWPVLSAPSQQWECPTHIILWGHCARRRSSASLTPKGSFSSSTSGEKHFKYFFFLWFYCMVYFCVSIFSSICPFHPLLHRAVLPLLPTLCLSLPPLYSFTSLSFSLSLSLSLSPSLPPLLHSPLKGACNRKTWRFNFKALFYNLTHTLQMQPEVL